MTPVTAYDDLLARTRGLIEATEGVPVVGISGHGGAGKSTLAARLAADLGLTEDQVLATDAFHATTCGPDAGMWEQCDWDALERVVRSAREGRERLRYVYRWWSGETGVEDHPMPSVLVVEGIRLFSDRTSGWFDLAVWLDMDPDEAGARAKARNVLQGDDEAELALWDTKWIPEGHDHERTERPADRADLVLRAAR
jgi:uridine kinase